jgi:hypothetical protein
LAVNLSGDFCQWTAGGLSVQRRHKDLIGTICPAGKDLFFTSENSIFVLKEDSTINKVASSHTLAVDRFATNSWAQFSSSFDKLLIRYENAVEV